MKVGAVLAAALAGVASGAMLSKNKAQTAGAIQDVWAKDSAEIKEKKEALQKDMDAWAVDKSDFRKKLKESGAEEVLEGSSPSGEAGKFQKQYAEIQEKARKKSLHLTHDEALDMLKGKLDDKQRDQMSLLMKKGKGSSTAEDEKAMYVKSMVALNDMFLSIDDERITTLVSCSVTLFDLYRQLWFHFDALRKLETMIGEAYSSWWKNLILWQQTWNGKEEQARKLDSIKAQQEIEMQEIDADLVKKEADVTLYRFIMGKIEAKCSGEADKKLMLSQTGHSKKMECQEKCNAGHNGRASVNAAVLKIFSDKDVVAAAKHDLDEHAQMSMEKTLMELQKAEQEEIHPKYAKSFLQLGQSEEKRQTPDRWMIVDNAACGCGSLEGVGCDTVTTLIGQELECAKQVVREQKAYKTKVEDEHADARADVNEAITALEKAMEQWSDLMMNAVNEVKQYRPSQWKEIYKIFDLWHITKDERWSCYLKLFELENNYYCAIKHIRAYMKSLTLEAFGAKEEDVEDCEAAEFMYPSGHCAYKHSPSEHVECIPGDMMPSNPDLLPLERWERQLIQPKEVSEKFNATMYEVAMDCPATMYMDQKCNTFLCPYDCEMTEWSDWSQCSAECDSGVQTQTRQMIKPPRNGGSGCGETSKSQECNTNPCDVDCVLHEDWVAEEGCLQACNAAGMPRYEMVKKHIAVEAKGRGECPDKHHESRIKESPCDDHMCEGDEQCNDVMDLVVAYECSNSVTRLGCWFMASFIVTLFQKMPTVTFGFPTMQIGLVKFGNGEAMPNGDGTYYVAPARKLSDLTWGNQGLVGTLYMDVMGLWSASSGKQSAGGWGPWKLGFNNIGQAMKLAGTILDDSDRTEGDVVARKKILVLTKGLRAGCTVVKSVAEQYKNKGVVVDLVLFSGTYASNPSQFEVLEESVSYPSKAHFHVVGALSKLNDWSFRTQSAQGLIPHICPEAISVKHTFKKFCDAGALLLHRGRTCHDWTYELCTDGPLTLGACRNVAMAAGFQGFIHTDVSGVPDATECNCLAKIEPKEKDENGQEKPGQKDVPHPDATGPQVDAATGKPLENTCENKQKQNVGGEKAGWAFQAIAAGDGDMTSHYMVISDNECPTEYSGYRWLAFLREWEPTKYFKGMEKKGVGL